MERPLQGICLLEFDAPISELRENFQAKDNIPHRERPKRIAKFAGEEARRMQMDILNQEE